MSVPFVGTKRVNWTQITTGRISELHFSVILLRLCHISSSLCLVESGMSVETKHSNLLRLRT